MFRNLGSAWMIAIEFPIFESNPVLFVPDLSWHQALAPRRWWGDGAEDLCGFPAAEHHRR